MLVLLYSQPIVNPLVAAAAAAAASAGASTTGAPNTPQTPISALVSSFFFVLFSKFDFVYCFIHNMICPDGIHTDRIKKNER